MKKIIAMVLVLVTLMSLGMAHAELGRITDWRVEKNEDGMHQYFVSYETQTGASHEFEATYDEFCLAVETLAKERNEEVRKQELAEKHRKQSWLANTAAWLSFWNPND